MPKYSLHFIGISSEFAREVLREKINHILSIRVQPHYLSVSFSGKKYHVDYRCGDIYDVRAVEKRS